MSTISFNYFMSIKWANLCAWVRHFVFKINGQMGQVIQRRAKAVFFFQIPFHQHNVMNNCLFCPLDGWNLSYCMLRFWADPDVEGLQENYWEDYDVNSYYRKTQCMRFLCESIWLANWYMAVSRAMWSFIAIFIMKLQSKIIFQTFVSS